MSVDETLLCSFQILKPAEKKPKYTYAAGAFPFLSSLASFFSQ